MDKGINLILNVSDQEISPIINKRGKNIQHYGDYEISMLDQQHGKSPKKTKYDDETSPSSSNSSSPTGSPPRLEFPRYHHGLQILQSITDASHMMSPSATTRYPITAEIAHKKLNEQLSYHGDHTCPEPPLSPTSSNFGLSSPKSSSHQNVTNIVGNNHHNHNHNHNHQHQHQHQHQSIVLLTKSKSFEESEQEVAGDEWVDAEEDDEDDDEYDDDEDYDEGVLLDQVQFQLDNQLIPSHFDDMRKHNQQLSPTSSSAPRTTQQAFTANKPPVPPSPQRYRCVPGSASSPKSHVGTPSRPFPTLDYKIKSEQVKQNSDGTYSCPYPSCNKTIKGNKGNLSSHLRWHRRLDAEAGEARGISLEEGEEEEFTTPLKPSQRGVQLRNQMIHYGLNLFRQDNQGKYLCFFDGCQLRMLTNFSRHIAKHERKGDQIKEDLKPFLPRTSQNVPRIMPCTPPSNGSAQHNNNITSSPQSANTASGSHQSTPFLYSSQSTPSNLSPLQDSTKSMHQQQKKKLTVNTSNNLCHSPVSSSAGVPNSAGVMSPPLLSPSFGGMSLRGTPNMLSSPPMDGQNFIYRKSASTSNMYGPSMHVDRIGISQDDNSTVPCSPSKLSSGRSSLSQSSASLSTSPNPFLQYKSKEEIQWIYKKPVNSSPSSPRVFGSPTSVVPTSPPSAPSTPTSSVGLSFAKLNCGSGISFPKVTKEDVAKSLLCLQSSKNR